MRDNTKYSSYWLKDGLFDDDSTIVNDTTSKQNNLLALASYKRAVSNFVNIVTGENINVTFDQRGGDSYTDGKSVTISAKMDDKDFDPTVGLALHEGSHIKLTDFNTLKDLQNGRYPNPIDATYIAELMDKYGGMHISEATQHINDILKNLLNVIEDRRIDNYIYTTSPGYKGYYHSMYDKYFNAKIVDKGLQSSEYRTNDWESYMFRIINITNAHRDLDALPMLRKVWEMLDLKNIGRLKNTYEALTLSAEIFKVIEDSIPSPQKSDNNDDSGNGSEGDSPEDTNGGGGDPSETNGSDNTEGSGGESTESSNGMDDSDGDAEGDDVMSGQPNRSSNGSGGRGSSDVPDLTDRQKKQLEKAIEKQKKFQNGDITKKKVSKTENEKLKTLSKAGIEQKEAGSTYGGKHHYRKNTSTPVIVVRNFTKQLVDSNTIDMVRWQDWHVDNNQQNIDKGIRIGIQLGKRLKVRSEERSLITPRMKNGRISGRLLHELGMGNTQIFDQTVINKHKPAFVHISIDASSSMHGSNWDNAQVAAVAIAKAASMTSNIDVVISYRSIQRSGNTYQPLTLIAYDSRKDKISKIQQLFKYLDTNGTTPEGLCFESILDDIVKTNKGVDSYFINFSDGQPGFDNNDIYYGGEYAVKHTAEQVRKMKMAGVKVMSYFISDYDYATDNFKAMYGKDAQRIDVTSLIPLTKTLNKMFE